MVTIPRTVIAELRERYIFNFRLPPEKLAARLPVTWLRPQVFDGWSVVSFCILSLQKVMIWPLPSRFGFTTISCAYRCGVIDDSDRASTPSVYVLDRNTDLPLIARLGPFLFLDTLPVVSLNIAHGQDDIDVEVRYLDRQPIFSARVRPRANGKPFDSYVFPDIDAFAGFIRGGVSSYTPSIFGDALARVDLHKEDPNYTPMDADVRYDWLEGEWREAGLELDSVVRASGGIYRWTYRGLKSQLPLKSGTTPVSAAARL